MIKKRTVIIQQIKINKVKGISSDCFCIIFNNSFILIIIFLPFDEKTELDMRLG